MAKRRTGDGDNVVDISTLPPKEFGSSRFFSTDTDSFNNNNNNNNFLDLFNGNTNDFDNDNNFILSAQ